MGDIIEFEAYHGTSKTCAQSIMATNSFIPSTDGWFGRGIYFFEKMPDLAKKFAECNDAPPISILKTRLRLDETKVLDICTPGSVGNEEFHLEKDYLEEKLIALGRDAIAKKRKYIDGNVIDILCKRKDYHLVRSYSYTFSKIDHAYNLSSKVPNGVELCVKHCDCVKNIEVFA